jgi:hypothetical protein
MHPRALKAPIPLPGAGRDKGMQPHQLPAAGAGGGNVITAAPTAHSTPAITPEQRVIAVAHAITNMPWSGPAITGPDTIRGLRGL